MRSLHKRFLNCPKKVEYCSMKNSYPKIIGIIFLLQFVSGVLYHQVLVGNHIFNEDVLAIAKHQGSIVAGVTIHLLISIGSLFAALLLLMLLKKYNFLISCWYLLLTSIAFLINFSNGVDAFILTGLSPMDETSISSIKERYYWTHMLGMVMPLFYFPPFFHLLYKHKLISLWISGLGFVASFLMPTAVIFGMCGLGENTLLMLPLALAQISLSLYLIIYGFKNYDYV